MIISVMEGPPQEAGAAAAVAVEVAPPAKAPSDHRRKISRNFPQKRPVLWNPLFRPFGFLFHGLRIAGQFVVWVFADRLGGTAWLFFVQPITRALKRWSLRGLIRRQLKASVEVAVQTECLIDADCQTEYAELGTPIHSSALPRKHLQVQLPPDLTRGDNKFLDVEAARDDATSDVSTDDTTHNSNGSRSSLAMTFRTLDVECVAESPCASSPKASHRDAELIHRLINARSAEQVPEVVGRMHSVESMSAVDGPGLRYLVFTQGCGRKCVFCQNPDTWDTAAGYEESSKRLACQIKKCRPYLARNNGGITISGGEPLMQPLFVAALFREAKAMGLTTCLDTTGFGSKRDWDLVLPFTDYVLLCLKSFDPQMYKKITSNTNRAAYKFTEELKARGIKFWLRFVLLPGWTDNEEEYQRIITFVKGQPSCQGVELLPYHRLGVEKWRRMGLEYPLEGLEPPKRELVEYVKKLFQQHNIGVLCS